MCDYSLHNVASRPAKVGDKLVTTKFDFLTRGFAAIGEPNVAVCLLPAPKWHSRARWSATIRLAACCRACSSVNLEIRWLDSGRSTWTARTCITTPWNSPMGRSCWSPVSARASGRRCCSCRPLRGSRAKHRSKCTLLPSPELSRSPRSGLRDGLLRASRVKRIAGRLGGAGRRPCRLQKFGSPRQGLPQILLFDSSNFRLYQ